MPSNCYEKLKFQDRLMTDLTFFERCTNFKQSYCFIKVHWNIKMFVKLKEAQLFYLVIKLTKAVVSAWQNFDRFWIDLCQTSSYSMKLRKYKTNSVDTVIFNLHQIKQRFFFGQAALYVRTSMCSLCICLIQFLTH